MVRSTASLRRTALVALAPALSGAHLHARRRRPPPSASACQSERSTAFPTRDPLIAPDPVRICVQ